MSGGSLDYICFRIDEELVGKMEDPELNDLMKDVSKLSHDLEWYLSGDTDQKDYQRSVKKFKKKWFESDRDVRLKKYSTKKH